VEWDFHHYTESHSMLSLDTSSRGWSNQKANEFVNTVRLIVHVTIGGFHPTVHQ